VTNAEQGPNARLYRFNRAIKIAILMWRIGIGMALLSAGLLVGSQLVFAVEQSDESNIDLRVLIDVSGSMKQNDPANLRIPALKLLVNLLPVDSNAGIWLFAADAVVLAPTGPVDQDWKSATLKSTRKIHSRGLYTNIETALENALEGWSETETSAGRSVILLTDGVVDVSKDPTESTESRNRIIKNLIPKIQQQSAQVHTIALSKNADHELLHKLAFDTGGWNESVYTAEQLQRVFLKMFNKAVPRESVPLKDNKFNIDNSVNEFSLLVFQKPGVPAARLIGPDGTEFSEVESSEKLNWLHETGYDLVTIKEPVFGEWQLIADVDPDNQVMIVTDLKLKIDQLPNYVSQNEALDIKVWFEEQGQRVMRGDFLKLVSVELLQTDELGRKSEWPMKPDPESSGEFIRVIGDTLSPGKHSFRIVADGHTFQREMQQTLEVVENPVKLDVSADVENDPVQIEISLLPDAEVIDVPTVEINAVITNVAGDSKDLLLEQDNGAWYLRMNAPPEKERLVINFSVAGKTLRGHDVAPKIKPVILDENSIADLLSGQDEESDEDLDEEEWEETETDADTEAEDQTDWVMTAVIAVVVNIVLFIGGFFGFKVMKKRTADQQSKLLERLAE